MSHGDFKHIKAQDWDQRLALVILATGWLRSLGHMILSAEIARWDDEPRILIRTGGVFTPRGELAPFDRPQTVTAPDPQNNYADATFFQVKRFGCLIQWRAD